MYYGARYYLPELRRFISAAPPDNLFVDPMGGEQRSPWAVREPPLQFLA
jgi:hypothetical protein